MPYSDLVPVDWDFDVFGRDDEMSSVFDVQANDLSAVMQDAVVSEFRFSEVNDLSITFPNGIVFEQFITASRKAEQWRLIDYKNNEHIVCYDDDGTISLD